MRRSGYYKKKDHKPDHKYGRVDMGRFINYLMLGGEKAVAERVFYNAMDKASKDIGEEPEDIFEQAIENASPMMEVISRRIGGANYQIPRKVRPERKYFLAAHWIIEAARSSKGSPIHVRLAKEIIDAYNNEGSSIKKKQNVHRMAEANRAFASFLR